MINQIELKLKNTKRAINITKTLFGMVDEMDSMDFCAQKDNAQFVLLKEKSETVENSHLIAETELEQERRSQNILDLVNKIENEMGTYKYSKLKQDRVPLQKPDNLARQSGHPYYINADDLGIQGSASQDISSDFSSSNVLDSSIVKQQSARD